MADIPSAVTRNEKYLEAIATGDANDLPTPVTREEVYLDYIAQNGGGGGGGGGTTNYNALSNRPQINGTTLAGNKTGTQLGLQNTLTFDNAPTQNSNNPVKSGGIYTALAEKVSTEAGKWLSSNDYTSEEKTKLAGIAAGAEANVIAHISLNGVEITPVNKTVALNVITRAVNNLQNYYLKTETYTKTEVDDLIAAISSLTLDIVETLPTQDISTTTIYLVPVTGATNVYMQYAYINNDWAQLGTTQIDLTNYYTKTQVDAALLLKQDVLTFDNVPTSASDNPVKSGGIYTALAGKQDSLTFDSAPTQNSTNPVTSGGLYTALSGKQNTLEFDSAPTLGSHKMVDSDAVATALTNVDVPVATVQQAGKVKPDGSTITIDNDGTIHGSNSIQVDEADLAFTDGLLGLQPARRMFVGTTAEWNALNAADKALYSVVSLTDDEQTGDFVYSTDERRVGTWLDGKPIYQKSYVIDTPSVRDQWTTMVSNVSALSIKKLVRGWYTSAQNKSAAGNELWQIDNSNNLQIFTSGFGIRVDTCTIQYTKTTD